MYPCPRCKKDRPELHADCVHCDWKADPQPASLPAKPASGLKTPRRPRFSNATVGCLALGAALMLGAIAFLIVTSLADFPGIVLIAGGWQLITGAGFILTGWLMQTGSSAARMALCVSLGALVINFALVPATMLSTF